MSAGIAPWLWLALAAVLIGIEVMAPSTWLIWPAISAALVGAGSFFFPSLDWRVQAVIFALLAIVTTILWQRWFRSTPSDRPRLNRRTAALVGRKGPLFADGLHLDDTIWRARTVDDVALAPGQTVEVVGSEGPVLLVRAIFPEPAKQS